MFKLGKKKQQTFFFFIFDPNEVPKGMVISFNIYIPLILN